MPIGRPLDDDHDFWCNVCKSGFNERDCFVEHFEATHW